MRIYRASWCVLASVLCMLGGGCAYLFLQPSALAAAAVDGVLIALAFFGVRRYGRPVPEPISAHEISHWAAMTALAGVAATSLAGVFAVLGPIAVPVVATLALSCPWVVSTATRARRPRTGLQSLTDAELCRIWRSSRVDLARARSVPDLMRVSEARRDVLDELIRRDADGIARWLSRGPRATADPGPYLQS
jgi:hypothetical protein